MAARTERRAPAAAAALLAAGAFLLLVRLGSPALWQDEAETALRAVTIQETGLPRESRAGVLVTAQPSLARFEANAAGVWTWNTWLPAYLCAGSFALLGRSALAARLPFALAALLAAFLTWRLAREGEDARPWAPELALAFLLLSPAYLLFARQSRYYALSALGAPLCWLAWRRLLAGRRGGALLLALALQLLLHSSFALFGIAGLALAADALLRGREGRKPRVLGAGALALALAAPVVWYFRAWDRPGNHSYPLVESLEFLKTFWLWLAAFACAPLLPAAADLSTDLARAKSVDKSKVIRACAGFVLLTAMTGEGSLSRAAGLVALLWSAQAAVSSRGLRRLCWLWLVATLVVLSLAAAEPYGRYLMVAFPAVAVLAGGWISQAARGRAAPAAALAALALGTNWLAWAPLKAAAALGAPAEPAPSVSGMMRRRLRDVGPRSDLARLAGELARGPRGYVEPAAEALRARGAETVFSDADNLSLLFAAGVAPAYPPAFGGRAPDCVLLSPWLRLDAPADAAAHALLGGGRYARVDVAAPRLLWQNNPDPLYRDFAPPEGPLPLFCRKTLGSSSR